jgi:hypothetical protein
MNICEAKNLSHDYEEEIRDRDDESIRSILSGDRYKHSKRPDFRYWYRLAVREAKKRGLT